MQDYENHQKEVAPQSYDSHIDGTKLDSVSVYRDLGLLTILSNVLSWNDHIANITSKVNSILGLIKRTCRDINNVTTLNPFSPSCVVKFSQLEPILFIEQV